MRKRNLLAAREGCRRYYAATRNARRAYHLVNEAHKRAKKKNLPFNLQNHLPHYQSLIEAGVCQLTGLPFVLEGYEEGKRRSPFSPSLDRIKPELGYVHGNVRIILWGLNAGLGDWGSDVYELIAKAFLERHRMPWER